MDFVLRHLSYALVLLLDYKDGHDELSWLIEAHLKRIDDLIRDDELKLTLRSVNVRKYENLNKILEVYNKVAKSELEADQKCSGDCGYVEPPDGYPHVCGKLSQDSIEDEVTSYEKEKTEYPEYEDDENENEDDENEDDEDEIEFSFERV